MPVLLDLALAILVLAGALFLGSVALTLFKEVNKPSNEEGQRLQSKTDDKTKQAK